MSLAKEHPACVPYIDTSLLGFSDATTSKASTRELRATNCALVWLRPLSSPGEECPSMHRPVHSHGAPLTRKWLQSGGLESATQCLTAAGACVLTDCCGAKIKSKLSIRERVDRVLGSVDYQPRRSQPPSSRKC
jgi:hypothetical protein